MYKWDGTKTYELAAKAKSYELAWDCVLPFNVNSLFSYSIKDIQCLGIHSQIKICGPCRVSLAGVMAELCEPCLSV